MGGGISPGLVVLTDKPDGFGTELAQFDFLAEHGEGRLRARDGGNQCWNPRVGLGAVAFRMCGNIPGKPDG